MVAPCAHPQRGLDPSLRPHHCRLPDGWHCRQVLAAGRPYRRCARRQEPGLLLPGYRQLPLNPGRGQEYGPVNPSELQVLVDSQLISPATPVRKVDDEGWIKASQISGLFEASSETNPRERRRSRRSDSSPPTNQTKRRESAVVAEPSDPSPPTNQTKRQKSAVVAITEHQRHRIQKLAAI